MVDTKRYSPTITRFQKHTKNFVSGKVQKGHLNQDDDKDSNVKKEEGVLVKIDKNNLYGNGWEVKIGNKTIKCSYGDNITFLPEYTVNGSYYIPKKECKVEVSIDKKSKINTITRIKDKSKIPIAMTNNEVKFQVGNNAALSITEDVTKLTGTQLKVEGDVTIDTSNDDDLPDKITITDLYKQVQSLETKVSGNNDNGKQ